MKTSDLLFIGIHGSVVALSRATGQLLWATKLKAGDFVNVVLDENRLLATTYGEVFCLDPLNGRVLWHNELKGLGRGLATIATVKSPQETAAVLAQKRRSDEQAAAAAATAAC